MVQESKNLKIVELIGSFTLAGAEIFAADLSKEFLKNGHAVKLISIFRSEDEEKYFQRVGQQVKRVSAVLEKKFTPGVSAFIQALKAKKKLENIIEEFRPDVIHTHTTYPDLVGKMIKKSYPHLKVVRTIHTTYDRFGKIRKFLMRFEENILPPEDVTVFISEKVKRSFKKNMVKEFDSDVIPICLDLQNFEEYKRISKEEAIKSLNLKISADTYIFISVGRLIELKNHKLLIEAFHETFKNDEKTFLLIVGDGPLRMELEHYIKTIRAKNIKLLGKRVDIPLLLRASNTFVLTSKWEGTPLSLLEAQAMELSIITTDVGGVRDIIYTQDVLYINPDNKEEMKEALIKIRNKSGLKNKEKHLKMTDVASKYLNLFGVFGYVKYLL